MKKKDKKGFTLIELIVVISVLGILVLLAAPKFLGYTEDAKNAQIENDIRAYEAVITTEMITNHQLIESWEIFAAEEIEQANESNKVYNKKGEIVNNLDGTNYIVPKNLEIKTQLKGTFLINENKTVFYFDE